MSHTLTRLDYSDAAVQNHNNPYEALTAIDPAACLYSVHPFPPALWLQVCSY